MEESVTPAGFTQQFPSNKAILHYDICQLFAEARAFTRFFSKALAMRNEQQIARSYFDAFYYLVQLFDTAKLPIRASKKIKDWDKREKVYRDFFLLIQRGAYFPEKIQLCWEELSGDIAQAGLYDEVEAEQQERAKKEFILNKV